MLIKDGLMQQLIMSFFVLNFIFSGLGLLSHVYYYSYLLITIVFIHPEMEYILTAITMNLHQIIYTMIIAFISIFIFASLAASKYQGMFFDENRMFPTTLEGGFEYKDICKTIGDCSWNFVNYGLRYGGGIGDIMVNLPNNPRDTDFEFQKQVFDIFFWVIINVLLLNMVFGIIIDTFAELRVLTDQKSSKKFHLYSFFTSSRSWFVLQMLYLQYR